MNTVVYKLNGNTLHSKGVSCCSLSSAVKEDSFEPIVIMASEKAALLFPRTMTSENNHRSLYTIYFVIKLVLIIVVLGRPLCHNVWSRKDREARQTCCDRCCTSGIYVSYIRSMEVWNFTLSGEDDGSWVQVGRGDGLR